MTWSQIAVRVRALSSLRNSQPERFLDEQPTAKNPLAKALAAMKCRLVNIMNGFPVHNGLQRSGLNFSKSGIAGCQIAD
jgi:hypothetical protein